MFLGYFMKFVFMVTQKDEVDEPDCSVDDDNMILKDLSFDDEGNSPQQNDEDDDYKK